MRNGHYNKVFHGNTLNKETVSLQDWKLLEDRPQFDLQSEWVSVVTLAISE